MATNQEYTDGVYEEPQKLGTMPPLRREADNMSGAIDKLITPPKGMNPPKAESTTVTTDKNVVGVPSDAQKAKGAEDRLAEINRSSEGWTGDSSGVGSWKSGLGLEVQVNYTADVDGFVVGARGWRGDTSLLKHAKSALDLCLDFFWV